MDNIQKYPVYFDPIMNKLYYIEWYDTGNNEMPTKIYIETVGWDGKHEYKTKKEIGGNSS